jgi:hypothetical protein
LIPEPAHGSLIIDEFGFLYERMGSVWHDLGTASQPVSPTPWNWADLVRRCGKLEVLYP